MYANRFKQRAAEEFGIPKLSRFQKVVGFGAWLIFTCLVAAFLVTAGTNCGKWVHDFQAQQGHVASAKLDQELDTAHTEITAAVPHTDATGQAHLQSADAAIQDGKASKLPAINTALNALQSENDRLKKENDQLKTDNKQLRSEFWSPRQRGLFLVVTFSIAGLAVALTLCFFLTPAGPVIGTIAAYAFHILTLGIPKLFSWIVARIKTNVWVAKVRAEIRSKAGTPAAPLAVSAPSTSSAYAPSPPAVS